MKKILFVAFTALLFGGTVAIAQTGTKDQVKTQPPNVLKWTTTNIDMGKIPQGTPASVVFNFSNTGSAPVVLKNVQPSCGCTTSDYTKEPVAKNKNGYVKATYNAANPGSFSKSVTVTTDSGEIAVLIIHGEVITKPADSK